MEILVGIELRFHYKLPAIVLVAATRVQFLANHGLELVVELVLIHQ